MAKEPLLTKALHFEKKNQDIVRLPKYARVQKRPIPHAPIASPYAGPSVPKTVYVSTSSPFMSAVKRVQKLLRQIEKRESSSSSSSSRSSKNTNANANANAPPKKQRKISEVAAQDVGNGQSQSSSGEGREEVFVKATGRAMEKALKVGRWFESRGSEYAVRVKEGSVLVVDDVVEDEEAKRRVIEGGKEEEKSRAGGDSGGGGDGREGVKEGASKSAAKKKRKRAADAAAAAREEEELPESRTRWVNMVEVAVSLK